MIKIGKATTTTPKNIVRHELMISPGLAKVS